MLEDDFSLTISEGNYFASPTNLSREKNNPKFTKDYTYNDTPLKNPDKVVKRNTEDLFNFITEDPSGKLIFLNAFFKKSSTSSL